MKINTLAKNFIKKSSQKIESSVPSCRNSNSKNRIFLMAKSKQSNWKIWPKSFTIFSNPLKTNTLKLAKNFSNKKETSKMNWNSSKKKSKMNIHKKTKMYKLPKSLKNLKMCVQTKEETSCRI